MISKFMNLEKEKQERIVNAAIKEFANKGYDQASTNEIVKNANISKGLLFHYFKNKKQLFLFVFDYCVELSVNDLYGKIDFGEKDVFLRLRQIMGVKLELISKTPHIIDFLMAAVLDESKEIKQYVEKKSKELSEIGYTQIFKDIDVSKFKKGVDIEKVMNIIIWTFEGISASEVKKLKHSASSAIDYKQVFKEVDRYIEILQESFYQS